MNKTKLLEIAHALDLGSIDDKKARALLLGLLGVGERTFSDAEIEKFSKDEIMYNDHKRKWWKQGALYIRDSFILNNAR